MRKGFLGSLAGFLASAGTVLAQATTILSPAPSATPALLPAQESVTPVPANGAKPTAFLPPPPNAPDSHLWQEPVASVPGRYYMAGDYLLWWPKRDNLPPLASNAAIGDLTATAALGQPSTRVLF